MSWRKVYKDTELPEGGKALISLSDEQEIALFRVKGKVFALDNICPHAGGPLAEGRVIDNCAVECPWHQWTFDLQTGDCENVPDTGVKVFSTKLEEGFIWIEEAGRE